MDVETMENRLLRWLRPQGFFAGLLLSFLACCIAGRQLPKLLAFQGFQRFHAYLDPQGLYFPTALQVRELARRELPSDKIAVLIGGSSVLQGIGQPTDGLWTQTLQEELGDDYRILNLAAVGGGPNEYSQLAAEMICRRHPRLIHICDAGVLEFTSGPDGRCEAYRYLFHDARARALLLPHAPRDAALAALEPQRRTMTTYQEMLLQTQGNRWLSFNDLWHVVAYEYCFTVWNWRARTAPWQARKHWRDPAPQLARENHMSAHGKSRVRATASQYSDDHRRQVMHMVRDAVPAELRPRTIVVINRFNPTYLAAVEAEAAGTRQQYDMNLQDTLKILARAGMVAVEGCSTLAPEDYRDFCHLRESGGAKLAMELAPIIRNQARRLGYLHAAAD